MIEDKHLFVLSDKSLRYAGAITKGLYLRALDGHQNVAEYRVPEPRRELCPLIRLTVQCPGTQKVRRFTAHAGVRILCRVVNGYRLLQVSHVPVGTPLFQDNGGWRPYVIARHPVPSALLTTWEARNGLCFVTAEGFAVAAPTHDWRPDSSPPPLF